MISIRELDILHPFPKSVTYFVPERIFSHDWNHFTPDRVHPVLMGVSAPAPDSISVYLAVGPNQHEVFIDPNPISSFLENVMTRLVLCSQFSFVFAVNFDGEVMGKNEPGDKNFDFDACFSISAL